MYEQALREMQKIRAAEAEVQPYVGEITGKTSERAVFAEAMTRLGHDAAPCVDGLTARKLFEMARGVQRGGVAVDYASSQRRREDREKRFPHAHRLG